MTLIQGLVRALTVIRDHNLLQEGKEESTAFQPVAPYEGLDCNRLPVSLLGRINLGRPLEEGETNIWLRNGPRMFLRLMPTQHCPEIEPLDLRDMMAKASLKDLMGYRSKGAFYWIRNREGAAGFTVDPNSQENNNALAFGFTQVFKTREIWGVDTWLLDPDRIMGPGGQSRPHIASFTLEEGMMVALSQYLLFARDHLKLSLPLRWVAGICDIGEHRLTVGEEFSERPYNDELIENGLIQDYSSPIHKMLEPFFEAVWKEFGVRRSPEASQRWEQATGFNLKG